MRYPLQKAIWMVAALSLCAVLVAPDVNGFVAVAAAPSEEVPRIPAGEGNIAFANPAADSGWVAVLRWAELTFEAHGLAVPQVTVAFGCAPEECNGRGGCFHSEPTPQITICAVYDVSEEMIAGNQRLILHELAHAWLNANVDDATREAFLEMRHLESWNDRQQPWSGRGCEQAANIIARTLVYGERARAGQTCTYSLLTGVLPPFGSSGDCTQLLRAAPPGHH